MTEWTQTSRHCWTSPTGYRIAAARCRQDLRYCVYTPPQAAERYAQRLKLRYERGESVPQVRDLIACVESAEAAREVCAEHAEARKPL